MTDTTRLASSTRELLLEAGGEVQIQLTSSGLRLRGVDGDRVVVRTRGGEDIDDEIVMEALPGRVVIRDAERGFRLGPVRLRTTGSADLDIDVPRTARVGVRTLSGDVDAAGMAGETHWATASGDVRLQPDGGPLTVESMSGDVTISASVAIAVRARSVSGDVRITAPRIDDLGASTTSGDVRVVGQLGETGDHTISSVSGDVELVTPSPVTVETQTIAGDVRASGNYVAEGGRGRRTIVAGAGTIRVAVRTTSGDIRFRAEAGRTVPPMPTAPVPPVAPAAPAAPAAPTAPLAPVPPAFGEAPRSAPAPVGPPVVVAEAEAAPNLVRPTELPAAPAAGPITGAESPVDRREAARLDVLRALERGDLDVEAASHRLEQLDEAGPRSFRGWC